MLEKVKTILLFISLVSFTYVLRDSNTSPGTFLKQHTSRILEDQQITKTLCQGISQENDITADERETASIHTASYAEKREGNPLVKFIEGPDPASKVGEDYMTPAFRSTVFFVALLVISFGFCIYFITVWCCVSYSFCEKYTICKGPKPEGPQKIYTIAIVVFMLGLVACGIAGNATSSGIKSGGQKIVCSVAVFAEKLLEGSNSEDWVGVEQMIKDLQIVLNEFTPMVVNLTGAPSLTATTTASGMGATIVAAQASAELLYTQNFAKKVTPRPDPALMQISYTPLYIQNLTNVKNAIQNEMSSKKSIIEQSALRADVGITKMRASSPIFLLLLQQANDAAANISKALASAENNITAAGEDANKGINSLSSGLTGIFVVNLALGVVGLAATVLTFFAFKYSLSLMNCSWCLISIVVLIGWLLSAVLYPTTMIVFEGCDVGNRVFSNETFFNITMNKFIVKNATDGSETKNGAKVKDFLHSCYYGDGDLIDGLNLTGVFDMFTDVFTSLDNIAPFSTYIGPVPNSILIPQQQEFVTNYLQGLIPDGPETTEDLATLNSLTNSETNSCTKIQDAWVLNSTQCPERVQNAFTSSSSADFNVEKPTCIGYDVWGSKSINQRYTLTTFPTSCGLKNALPESTYLQNFVKNFVDARNDVNSIFGSLQSGLSHVATANTAYMTSVKLATTAFNPVWTSTVGTRGALWDPTTGFIQNSNCTFLKKATEDVLDSVCVRFGNSLYSTMVVTIGFSCFGFIGALLLFCFSMKFLVKKDKVYSHRPLEESSPEEVEMSQRTF